MAETSCQYDLTGIARLKLFWALSRTPHGLLDMCTAALASLLWLGYFPSFKIIGLGLITVFAGYTAVYALNDVVGYRSDKKKVQSATVPIKRKFSREICGALRIVKISMRYLCAIRWRADS
jgi:4-hydroxybenzoate polyprenyltransferase